MEEFKNLKEIIELCRVEIYTGDRNIHATLGIEELKELQCLLDNYNVHKRSNEMLLTQKREQEKMIELMAEAFKQDDVRSKEEIIEHFRKKAR